MPSALLTTKLFIPAPGNRLVERTRLSIRLEGCLRPDCHLTLVSAPAGFGKTMLASDWIRAAQAQNNNLAVAWISLDEQDNDSNRFWSYVLAAFQTFDKHFGKDAEVLLSGGHINNTDPVLTILINELARTTVPILLVLDDFHFIEQAVIVEALAFLLERLPPNVHVMILTRSDPHLPLARLRSRNQLLEIRLVDLRFSLEEADAFLNNAMGLHLASAPIETLHAKTEGWAAGLQMAGLALQRITAEQPQNRPGDSALKRLENVDEFVSSFSGSNRYILDYLLEEVLRRQPLEIQTFLLKTSILDRFCAPLCDAIIENWEPPGESRPEYHQSQSMLEYLEKENLFLMALDNERCWYRYHQLFADLLKKRLRQIHPADEQNLHARASDWYEENQLLHQAVEHAFQAADYPRGSRLLEKTGETMLKHGEYQWLLKWIQRLPEQELQVHWKLYLYKATILASVGQLNQAENCLEAFERLRTANLADNPLDGWQSGQAATVQALIAIFRGDTGTSRRFANVALETIPLDSESPWRAHLLIALSHINQLDGNFEQARQNLADAIEAGKRANDIYMTLDATTHLMMMLASLGQLKQAEKFAQQGLQYIEQFGLDRSGEASMVFLGWGFLLCEQHKLEQAEEYIRRGVETCQKAALPGMMGWAYQVNMRYLIAIENWPAAEQTAQEAERLAREVEIPAWIESGISALRAQIWIRQGKLSAAEQYLRERGIVPGCAIKAIEQLEYTALGSLLVLKGELDSAEQIIEQLLQRAERNGFKRLLIMNLIQLALVYQARKNQPLAMKTLKRALDLSETDGYIQLFLDTGDDLLDLLRTMASQDRHADFIRRILDEPGSQSETIYKKTVEPAEQFLKAANSLLPLSRREIEVLRLMAEGLSNKEIAARLFISLRTVKYHATSIFTKLNVNNRIMAVAQARDLSIL